MKGEGRHKKKKKSLASFARRHCQEGSGNLLVHVIDDVNLSMQEVVRGLVVLLLR